MVGIFHLLRQLHHELPEHEWLHVDAQDVQQLPVSQLQLGHHIIQSIDDPDLVGRPAPQHHVPHRGGTQQEGAVQEGEG